MLNPYAEDDDARERLRKAAMLSLGVTGGLAGGQGLTSEVRDRLEEARMPKTRAYRDFLKKLQPGDMVFHRRPSKYSAQAELGGGQKMPFSEADAMVGGKGDVFYHPSVYQGGGVTTEAAGFDKGVKRSRLRSGYPEELRAYRPKNAEDAAKALAYTAKMEGSEYKLLGDMVKHGTSHLFGTGGPRTTGLKSACGKDGIVCSELVAEAYPRIFKDRFMSPLAMRHSKDVELVARFGNIAPRTMREAMLSRLVYPVAKNLKWGALAGAAGLGAMTLLGGHDDEHGST